LPDENSDSDNTSSDDMSSSWDSDASNASLGNIIESQRHVVGRPRALPGSKADNPRNDNRRLRYKERKHEKKLEQAWRIAVTDNNDTVANELQQELMKTHRGRSLFPGARKSEAELAVYRQLASNVKLLNTGLGQRSKHRGHLALKVTKDLPPAFCKEVLAFDPALIRQGRKRERDNPSAPALVTDHRSENGRARWSPEFEIELGNFFISRTEILSGAKTNTRRLLKPKGRVEAELYAEFPAVLRQAASRDPDMLPDSSKPNKVLTSMQKICSLQYMLQRNIHSIKRLNIKPDLIRSWSGNRLIAIPIFFMRNVLRRVQDEVSTHLEKLGLAPGRTSKPARGQHTIADFQPENHEITSIASSTFWQVH
jgi:hypothetical protein